MLNFANGSVIMDWNLSATFKHGREAVLSTFSPTATQVSLVLPTFADVQVRCSFFFSQAGSPS